MTQCLRRTMCRDPVRASDTTTCCPRTRRRLGSRCIPPARAAFPSYANTTREERIALLERVIEVFKKRMGDVAEAWPDGCQQACKIQHSGAASGDQSVGRETR